MLQPPWWAVEEGVKRFKEVSMLNEQTVSLENPPEDFVLQEGPSNKDMLVRTTCLSSLLSHWYGAIFQGDLCGKLTVSGPFHPGGARDLF